MEWTEISLKHAGKTSTIDSSFFIVTLENALLVLNTLYIGSENLINPAARPSFEFKILIPDGPTIKHK